MTSTFGRVAGWCALAAGAAALVYSVTFAVVVEEGDRWAQWTSSTVLALGAFLALPVLTALYLRLRPVDEGFALLGLLVGAVAAAGTLLHALFDIGVLANEPEQGWEFLSPTDPRGAATFLLTGVTIAIASGLLARAGAPRALVAIGWGTAVLVAVVWIGRLSVLDPKEPWVAPAVVGSGFLGVPVWYAWVGRLMLAGGPETPEASVASNVAGRPPATVAH